MDSERLLVEIEK